MGDDQALVTALDVTRHDRMVALVTQTAAGVDLYARPAVEGVPHEKAALQRCIEMTDRLRVP